MDDAVASPSDTVTPCGVSPTDVVRGELAAVQKTRADLMVPWEPHGIHIAILVSCVLCVGYCRAPDKKISQKYCPGPVHRFRAIIIAGIPVVSGGGADGITIPAFLTGYFASGVQFGMS